MKSGFALCHEPKDDIFYYAREEYQIVGLDYTFVDASMPPETKWGKMIPPVTILGVNQIIGFRIITKLAKVIKL